MRKRLLVALVAVFVIVLVALGLRLPALAHIGTGYSAEQVCACVFISGRTPESCHGDLDPLARKLISVKVGANEVTARGMGLSRARARYEKGFGCTLLE